LNFIFAFENKEFINIVYEERKYPLLANIPLVRMSAQPNKNIPAANNPN